MPDIIYGVWWVAQKKAPRAAAGRIFWAHPPDTIYYIGYIIGYIIGPIIGILLDLLLVYY